MEFDYCLFEYWIGIVADFATILGAGSIIVAVILFFKNRVNKKSFQCRIPRKKCSNYADESKITLDLEMINYTDKEFSVSNILFIINDKEYQVSRVDRESIKPYIAEAKHLRVESHISFLLKDLFFSLPPDLEINSISLRIETTEGNLNYPLNRTEYRNLIQNAD